mmetsp:Transcript_5454/g.11232  ORF Transcript_5454/g.11232 Transcript_5454/m.11232 type:complete len:95 (+) Transcript_5454:137-421(+)
MFSGKPEHEQHKKQNKNKFNEVQEEARAARVSANQTRLFQIRRTPPSQRPRWMQTMDGRPVDRAVYQSNERAMIAITFALPVSRTFFFPRFPRV